MMKKLGIGLLFLSAALLLGAGITEVTNLSLVMSLLISFVVCTLFYLMLDLRPEADPGAATLVRLTRGASLRKR